MNESRNDGPGSERAAESALREGLRSNVLSAAALQRIRAATEQEWRETTRAAPRSRRRYLAIAASAVGAVAVSLWAGLSMRPAAEAGAMLGQVAIVEAPGILEERRFATDATLAAGDAVRAGQHLQVRGDAAVNIASGGNLRIARASAVEILAADAVSLSRGELYVDIPPGAHAASSFRVVTSAGEFRHVGTQFAVMASDAGTRLRVREGQVVWRAASGESTVNSGTEVTIDGQGRMTQRPLATAGRDWSWTEAMAPDVVIEGRPLFEFLEWFARETGRKLELDDTSREQSKAILMHGSVSGLTLTEALSAVMATTPGLKYELPEGVIRVSSARGTNTPRT